jgi:hypothetical protein
MYILGLISKFENAKNWEDEAKNIPLSSLHHPKRAGRKQGMELSV